MKLVHAVIGGALCCAAVPSHGLAAPAPCATDNASVPAGANTTAASKPFYIDTTGLDLKTEAPTRDPANPDYPRATALADQAVPSARADGNFILGPTHTVAPETVRHDGVRGGRVVSITMSSNDSVNYRPGMVRDDADGCRNAAIFSAHTAPGDLSNMIVTTSHPGQWTRSVDVYVPAGRLPRPAPFIVFGDGGPKGFFNERQFFTTLDNLIHQHRLPPMVAIGIGAGGQDAQGSERGREYDAVNGIYAEWVEHEVLPRVEATAHVKLTHDPDGRATMGISSSGVAAFTMAWFHPEWYHRVLAYSPTMVNQQWPHDSALPGGAWEYHDDWPGPAHAPRAVEGVTVSMATGNTGVPLIPNAPHKPIRYWFETGDRDLFYPAAALADGMHDWVLANEHMAKVLAASNYQYQFVFARNAVHVDKPTVAQTLPEALEYVWQGYRVR